jgi:hypothetical protein
MNAVREFASVLPRHSVVRLLRAARAGDGGEPTATTERARDRIAVRFELSLTDFLNALSRGDLDRIATALAVDTAGGIGELRARLWSHGANLESGGSELGRPWQPIPIVLRGKLVHMADRAGASPPTDRYPRRVPGIIAGEPPLPPAEPECLDELLDRATSLIGVGLAGRGRDKGAYGARVASLLGVVEHNCAEPDWRGEVEIKTLPVVVDRSGFWRVKEDPAVSMENSRPIAKLLRVLWIARVADDRRSPILSWFYQELDRGLWELAARYLHRRPKGGRGATTRGWYLHKRFFADSGLLRSLNG